MAMVRVLGALVLTATLGSEAVLGSQTIYVDGTNPNCPGTGTLSDPFCRIQDALVASRSEDTIKVFPGVYLENVNFLGKAVVLESVSGPTQTIIDAQGIGSVVTIQGPPNRDAMFQPVLRGFTIRGGNGTLIETSAVNIHGYTRRDIVGPGHVGGGVLVLDASPLITGNIITSNYLENGGGPWPSSYGAGIFCENGRPTIRQNTISRNFGDYGGGVFLVRCHGFSMTECLVVQNSDWPDYRYSGGGAYFSDSDGVLQATEFSGNGTDEAPDGGGVTLRHSSIEMSDCRVNSNGNIQAWTGGLLCFDSSVHAEDCDFSHNSGGGVAAVGGSVVLIRCTLNDNYGFNSAADFDGSYFEMIECVASGNYVYWDWSIGGGVTIRGGSRGRIVGCHIIQNELSNACGGGVLISEGSDVFVGSCVIAENEFGQGGDGCGGGFFISGSSPTIVNCTIAYNTANDGPGIYISGNSAPWLYNTVVWGNHTGGREYGEIHDEQGNLRIDYSNIKGAVYPGIGNISADPLFAWDPWSNRWRYQLTASSPCINKGNEGKQDGLVLPPIDMNGDPRVRLHGVDIGAHEYQVGWATRMDFQK